MLYISASFCSQRSHGSDARRPGRRCVFALFSFGGDRGAHRQDDTSDHSALRADVGPSPLGGRGGPDGGDLHGSAEIHRRAFRGGGPEADPGLPLRLGRRGHRERRRDPHPKGDHPRRAGTRPERRRTLPSPDGSGRLGRSQGDLPEPDDPRRRAGDPGCRAVHRREQQRRLREVPHHPERHRQGHPHSGRRSGGLHRLQGPGLLPELLHRGKRGGGPHRGPLSQGERGPRELHRPRQPRRLEGRRPLRRPGVPGPEARRRLGGQPGHAELHHLGQLGQPRRRSLRKQRERQDQSLRELHRRRQRRRLRRDRRQRRRVRLLQRESPAGQLHRGEQPGQERRRKSSWMS